MLLGVRCIIKPVLQMTHLGDKFLITVIFWSNHTLLSQLHKDCPHLLLLWWWYLKDWNVFLPLHRLQSSCPCHRALRTWKITSIAGEFFQPIPLIFRSPLQQNLLFYDIIRKLKLKISNFLFNLQRKLRSSYFFL